MNPAADVDSIHPRSLSWRARSWIVASFLVVGTGLVASATAHDPAPPEALGTGATIRVQGTALYCNVEALRKGGKTLVCYDESGGVAGAYGVELNGVRLTIIRFRTADKAGIVWSQPLRDKLEPPSRR